MLSAYSYLFLPCMTVGRRAPSQRRFSVFQISAASAPRTPRCIVKVGLLWLNCSDRRPTRLTREAFAAVTVRAGVRDERFPCPINPIYEENNADFFLTLR